tara:strand:- start:134 stop:484 length:351 start_codon:yes stop_codon:yes gene_type:complete
MRPKVDDIKPGVEYRVIMEVRDVHTGSRISIADIGYVKQVHKSETHPGYLGSLTVLTKTTAVPVRDLSYTGLDGESSSYTNRIIFWRAGRWQRKLIGADKRNQPAGEEVKYVVKKQ